MDNQTPTGSFSAEPAQSPQQPMQQSSQNNPKGKQSPVLLVILVILLLGGLFLGYTYKNTNDKLKQQSQELSQAYKKIEEIQPIVDEQAAIDTFIDEQNNAALSNSLCSGAPVRMVDVHLNDEFAVFRYFCSGPTSEATINIASLKKLDDGSYEFTYGSATGQPNALPSYIYDTEPEFFASYGAVRF